MTPAHATQHPLLELQQTLYASGNYTRRRLHRQRRAWIEASIKRYTVDVHPARAAEFGPGCGVYLPSLAHRAHVVWAIDVEPAFIEALTPLRQQLPNLQLMLDDVMAPATPPASFDLVLCSEVLEHVPDPEVALANISMLMAPGAIAIVSTPQRHSVMEWCCKVAFLPGVIQVVRRIYREPILPTGHISLRSRPAFQRAIAASGLEILEQASFGLYLPLVAEFGGSKGGRLLEGIERVCSSTPLSHLFWTQAYVLRKPIA